MNKADLRKSRIGGRAVQATGTAYAKDLGQDRAWFFRGAGRRPAWLEQSERGGEGGGESGEGLGPAVQACGQPGAADFIQGNGEPWRALDSWRGDVPPKYCAVWGKALSLSGP